MWCVFLFSWRTLSIIWTSCFLPSEDVSSPLSLAPGGQFVVSAPSGVELAVLAPTSTVVCVWFVSVLAGYSVMWYCTCVVEP